MATGTQAILLVEDDPGLASALAAALERRGRRIVICADRVSADLVMESERVDAVVTDVKLSGAFSFDGLDLIRHARIHAPQAKLIGISGSIVEGLAAEVGQRGAKFLNKPFEISELEHLVGSPPPGAEAEPQLVVVPTIGEVVDTGEVRPEFQRIVRLVDGSTFAYESLARLRGDSVLSQPHALFRYAERMQRTVDLNLVCIRSALRAGAPLLRGGFLFVNVDGRVFAEGERVAQRIERDARDAGVPLDRVVFELTEQHPFSDSEAAFAAVAILRRAGARIAFDDVGVDYSHLPFIGRLQPSFLKISQKFGTGFEGDPIRMKLVRNIVSLARDFDCRVILEGVETEATADAAGSAGIELAQGYHFAHPASVESLARQLEGPEDPA